MSDLRLFLSGDVMTGRGIDQILPHSNDPILYEPYVKSAETYVNLAETRNGSIPDKVDYEYIWGDALEIYHKYKPDIRIINLETAITSSEDYWKGKGIHYRMHPDNIGTLLAAGIDVCVLANNHVLDWGISGFLETLRILEQNDIQYCGAGENLERAQSPALRSAGNGRVLVFGGGTQTSGIPLSWKAGREKPGVNVLDKLSFDQLQVVKEQIQNVKMEKDIIVFSIHWGGNWGYPVPRRQQRFAHQLIDEADVDIVHGHSSHHVKGIEVYKNKLILYGCGDLLTDYEGITGKENFRDELGIMYFPEMIPETGELKGLSMVPVRVRNFQLHRADVQDAEWLAQLLSREGKKLGTSAELIDSTEIQLHWGG